ncbi:hypothetical protein DMH20_01220 [Escherichia coli]|nr:hypothetical protein [Escherichia coli]
MWGRRMWRWLSSVPCSKRLRQNKVMEFVGPGVAALSTDFRNSVDVMTTETTCLSSVWQTDEEVHNWLALHGRGGLLPT